MIQLIDFDGDLTGKNHFLAQRFQPVTIWLTFSCTITMFVLKIEINQNLLKLNEDEMSLSQAWQAAF